MTINRHNLNTEWALRPSTLFSVLLLALLLLLAWPAMAGPIENAREDLDEARAASDSLEQSRSDKEARYRQVLEQIEELKAGSGNIVSTFELKDLLTTARAQADELTELASEQREARAIEKRARTRLLQAFDDEIGRLEDRLLKVQPAEQVTIIQRLEALQVEREQERQAMASRPLEPVALPDLDGFESSDPDELRAAADELEDAEEQIRNQIIEIQERIRSVERRRKLYAYAEDTADQANLFGEDARSTRVSGTRQSSDGARNDKSETDTGTVRGEGSADPGNSPPPENSPAENPNLNFEGAADPDVADDDMRSPAPESDGVVADPPVAPPAPALDADTGSVTTGVIRSDADVGVLAPESSAGSAAQLDRELRSLKKRKQRLDRSLDKLEAQQEKLRKKAESVSR